MRIRPNYREIEADFTLATPEDRTVAKGLPQDVKRLPEGSVGMFVVEIGPEQTEDGIAATKAVQGRRSQVGEQHEALGLQREGTYCTFAGAPQLQAAQSVQLDHLDAPLRPAARASPPEVTPR